MYIYNFLFHLRLHLQLIIYNLQICLNLQMAKEHYNILIPCPQTV